MAKNSPQFEQVRNILGTCKTREEAILKVNTQFKGAYTVHETYFRAETQLKNNGTVKFLITNTANASNVLTTTEQRIDTNDLFIVDQLGFFIKKVVSGAHGKARLHTYPNPGEFVAGSTFVPADLEILYNGRLEVKTGSTTFLPALEMQRFRKVPILPQGQTLYNDGTNTASIAISPMDSNDGFINLPRFLLLHGDAKHDITLTLPDSDTAKIDNDVSNCENFAVLVGRGFIIQNFK